MFVILTPNCFVLLPSHCVTPVYSGKRRRVDSKASSDHDEDKVPNKPEPTSSKLSAKRCVRTTALWDSTKKDIFFEGINEVWIEVETTLEVPILFLIPIALTATAERSEL